MSHFLYGKQRSERDFVRHNAGEFQKCGMDSWFQQGVELLHSDRLVLSELPYKFAVFANYQLFLGVFRQSEDAVGRRFPLVIGKKVRLEGPIRLSELFLDHLEWYEALASTLVEIAAAGAKAASEKFTMLEGFQTGGSLPLSVTEYLSRSSLFEFKAALGPIDAGGGYALRTLQLGCEQALQRPAERDSQTITLDFPAPTDGLRILWLEVLARKMAPNAGCPSVFWTENRMLACLGPTPAIVLAYLANPEHKGSKLWPMHTLNRAAMADAAEAIKERTQGVFDKGDGTLLDALEACLAVLS